MLSDEHFVFFNNTRSARRCRRAHRRQPHRRGRRGRRVDQGQPRRRAAEVDKIVFPVTIYEAENRRQGFGQVRNAFIRIVNEAGGKEIARYDLTEDASTETAMLFGELYRNGAEWKFRAVGQGYSAGLKGIVRVSGSMRRLDALAPYRGWLPGGISCNWLRWPDRTGNGG